jgi:Protein of unknown function (DUF3455)
MGNRFRVMAGWVAPIGLFCACAATPAVKSDDLPEALRVPAGEVLSQRLHATGVQIYECSAAKADAAHFEWQLKEPAAELFDASGRQIGKHYAGPSWEARDGSKVIGELVARADAPQPNAIAWLLLRAKSTSGTGIFAHVHFIQRLHTAGGSAPQDGCEPASAGRQVRVSYSADYWFYEKPAA